MIQKIITIFAAHFCKYEVMGLTGFDSGQKW